MSGFNPVLFYEYGKGRTNLNTNLVAYYAFENNLVDAISGNNGTANGVISYNTGIIGSAVSKPFNGDISIPDSTDLNFSNGVSDIAFSISFWYHKSDASSRTIFNKRGGTAATDQYMINMTGGSTVDVNLYSNTTTAFLRKTYVAPIANGTFYHFCITYNGSGTAAGIKIYFNGVLQTSTDASVGVYTTMPIANQVERIGVLWDGTLRPGMMRIDELAIWKNRELTATDVSKLYNSGAGKTYPL